MEQQIQNAVRQLDLRSVKEHGQEKLRSMIGARRSAQATISSAPGSATSASTSPQSSLRRGGGGGGGGALGTTTHSGGRSSTQARRGLSSQALAEKEEQLAAAAAESAQALAAAHAELQAAQDKARALEESMQGLCACFSAYVASAEAGGARDYFAVTFPAGAIGERHLRAAWVQLAASFFPGRALSGLTRRSPPAPPLPPPHPTPHYQA